MTEGGIEGARPMRGREGRDTGGKGTKTTGEICRSVASVHGEKVLGDTDTAAMGTKPTLEICCSVASFHWENMLCDTPRRWGPNRL